MLVNNPWKCLRWMTMLLWITDHTPTTSIDTRHVQPLHILKKNRWDIVSTSILHTSHSGFALLSTPLPCNFFLVLYIFCKAFQRNKLAPMSLRVHTTIFSYNLSFKVKYAEDTKYTPLASCFQHQWSWICGCHFCSATMFCKDWKHPSHKKKSLFQSHNQTQLPSTHTPNSPTQDFKL